MNELKHLAEFQKILNNYHVPEKSRAALKGTKLMLMTAATSAGRNTIISELLKTGNFHYIVSDTTRKPRTNNGVPEQDGVEYWFKTEEEMLNNLRDGKMLEAAIIHNQQVSGISIREIERAEKEGKVATTDIEVVGTDMIVDVKPDAMCLFIIPPNFEEWQRRLKHRGAMDPGEVKRRLESAAMEFELALAKDYYWIIVNDQLDQAVDYIKLIAQGVESSKERQAQNREVLRELLKETRKYLKAGN